MKSSQNDDGHHKAAAGGHLKVISDAEQKLKKYSQLGQFIYHSLYVTLIKFIAVLLGEASKIKTLKNPKQLKLNDLTSKLAKHQKENIPPADEAKPAEKKVKTRSQKRS